MRAGRVEQLWVYPVKSLGGQRVAATRVGRTGLDGDRAWAVATPEGERLTARAAPGLRAAAAAVPEVPAGGAGGEGPAVRVGAGPARTGAGAEAALAELVGRPVRLLAAEDGATHADVAPVHLVSRAALAAAAGVDHAGHDAACPCSHEDPRANVVLDLELPGGGDETGLVGAELALGAARLRVTRRPKHCLGVYAEVLVPGAVAEGDPVRVLAGRGGDGRGAGETPSGTVGASD
ncbi:sulfurase [Vallicoccus soli]|uniref:Sulfurase n=1 Tax=Vallicoccus soli TaxID=2339232 RepID=A0A3A3ZD89_9ACTN|nr:sulfurase [Vallicoccus soli]